MKFLFCPLASYGFVYPAIGIAKALCQRGHQVAFVTGAAFHQILLQVGIERIPFGEKDEQSFQTELWGLPQAVLAQVQHIEYAFKYFAPDVIVASHLTIGAAIAGECYQIPVALLGGAAYLFPVLKSHFSAYSTPDTQLRLGSIHAAMIGLYDKARNLLGLPPRNYDNYEKTPLLGDLFLLQSIPALEGDVNNLPQPVNLVGACLWEPAEVNAELAYWLEPALATTKPIIYVQHKRFAKVPSFWSHLVAALENQPIRVITSFVGMCCDAGTIPANFFVRDHIPQGLVLQSAQTVINAGSTTAVLGAITHGLPSLLIPIGGEQIDVAMRYQRAGVAKCLSPGEVSHQLLVQALQDILDNPSYKQSAQALQYAFKKVNGCDRSADLLEVLGITRSPVLRNSHVATAS